jgi:hypothetical protein
MICPSRGEKIKYRKYPGKIPGLPHSNRAGNCLCLKARLFGYGRSLFGSDSNRGLMCRRQFRRPERREGCDKIFLDQFRFYTNFFRLLPVRLTDSESGGPEAEREQLHEKIVVRKARRIPVGKFILFLAAIILTVVVLEYFI